jgi:hypothetical protein
MPSIKCFLIQPTDQTFQWLRRYTHEGCMDGYGHDASVRIEDGVFDSKEYPEQIREKSDPRWPKECDKCHALFDDTTQWQLFVLRKYKREDTGEMVSLGPDKETQVPPGGMFYADWLSDIWPGPDGRSLSIMTPGGIWHIDSQASNCTRKDDNVHRCWIRKGIPPIIDVTKDGDTCKAGAGSIQCGNYHGFLRKGYLVD